MESTNGSKHGIHTRYICIRFHIWEPIWCFNPNIKQPKNYLLKSRWLGIAQSCGDALTYYIWTEEGTKRPQVLIRSIIRTRRKNIGKSTVYIKYNSELAKFHIDPKVNNNNDENGDLEETC